MFGFIYGAAALILIPVLSAVYYFRYKDRTKLWQVFQSKKHWKNDIRLSDSSLYFWQKFLALSTLFLIIIAFMKPQFGQRFETIERQGKQLFIIIDTSLSMLAEDGAKTRLDLGKYHIQQLIPKLDGDYVSIIPYADSAYTFLPLTSDKSAVTLFLDDVSVGMIGSGGSDIVNALKEVKNKLKKSAISDASTILIVTDGEFNQPINSNELKEIFKKNKITTMVIGMGTTQGEPIPLRSAENELIEYKKDQAGSIVLSKRNDEELKRLADALNGRVIIGEKSPLVAEKIYQFLTKVETQKLQQQQKVTKIDRYHWFLGLALLLFMCNLLLPKIRLKFSKIGLIILCATLSSNKIYANHPGVNAYENQNYNQAEIEFNKALSKNPESKKVIYNLGNTLFKLNEYEKSIRAYEEVLEQEKETSLIDVYYNLGTAYLKKSNYKKAFQAYKEVLKLDPNHLKTKQNIEIALRDKNQSNNQKNDQANDENSEDQNENKANESKDKDSQKKRGESENKNMTKQEYDPSLSEDQIKYLVNKAEQDARKKRQKIQQKLFEGSTW